MDDCCVPVRNVVELVRDGAVDDHERQALLGALDAVPRQWCDDIRETENGAAWRHAREMEADWKRERDRAERAEADARRWREAWGNRLADERDACVVAEHGWLQARAERAEAERDVLREALRDIASDMPDEDRRGKMEIAPAGSRQRLRDVARAALSADADADAEPDCSDHKHSRSGGRTHQCPRCGRYTFPPEPSRAEGVDGRSRAAIATEAVEQAARSRMAEVRVHTLEVALRRLLEFVEPQGLCLCHGQGMCAVCQARAALEGGDRG